MSRFLITILFLVPLAINAQKVMTLSECIQLAWQNNLQVKQAELSLDSREAQMKNSKTNTLPNLNGFANHNYNWGQRIDPFTNQFANTRVQSNSFGLSSSLNLFNGLQNHYNIKAQQAAYESAEYDLESRKNDIALATASAYLLVLLTDELVTNAENQVRITQSQLDRVKKLVDAGSSNIGNQYDLEAQLARDNSSLTQRMNDNQLALLQLKQLLMLPADEAISLEKPQNLDVNTSNSLEASATVYGYAESSMPEIKRAERSISQWDNQIKMNQSGYYPSLTLSGSIGTGYSGLRTEAINIVPTVQQIGFTSTGETVFTNSYDADLQKVAFAKQLNDNFNQFVGLSLNVPIFNRGNVSTSVKQAKINQSIAELQLEQEKQDLRQRIESARADAVAAKALYQSNESTVASAQKSFDFANIRFEAGALNVTDFNNAKNNLQIAQTELARSKYDLAFKTKVLDFYMGKPLSFE
ncbi:MAG: TolC family protein [Flavobacteriales bacterium]